MAEVTVNSTTLNEKATSFEKVAKEVKNYTEDMKKTINKLRPIWEGLASENTQKVFGKFQATFDEKYETIMNFSKFLKDTAKEYEKTENANAQII